MRHWGLSILLVLVASPSRTEAQESTDPLERLPELRHELRRIEQLPTEQQKQAIPRFYKDIHPILRQDWGLDSVWQQSYALLDKHRAIVKPLVEADLQSHDPRAVERALDVIGELKLKEFFDPVAAIFRKNDALVEAASIALRDLDDPRAIRLLVDSHPQDPLRYFEFLHLLCRSRPAEPALVKHLSAKDAQIRERAAYALAGSGDDSLVPHVQKLTKDAIPMVRLQAGRMGFNLSKDGFARVRADLVVLLTDRAPGIRLDIACLFASKRDPVCASTLLDLLKEDIWLDQTDHSRVLQAVHDLTGSSFGYYHGSDGWEPTTPNNAAAIQRFSRWVEENGRKPSGFKEGGQGREEESRLQPWPSKSPWRTAASV